MLLTATFDPYGSMTSSLIMNSSVPSGITPWYNPPGKILKYLDGLQDLTPYPICNLRWGHSYESKNKFVGDGLTILDIVALASYSYSENDEEIRRFTNTSFWPEEDAKVIYVDPFKTDPPRMVVTRFGPDNGNGTIVLAVKGTSNPVDCLTDAGFWTGVFVMQFFNVFVPFFSAIPPSVVEFVLRVTMFSTSFKQMRTTVDKIVEMIQTQSKNYPNDQIVLTGHSLGGGLVEIAAAQVGVPTVDVSGLGNKFSVSRFIKHYKPTRIYDNIVSIMPDYDMVPRIDWHNDAVQHIQCRDAQGFQRGSLMCHGVYVTACEIWRACGDPKMRNFEPLCYGTDVYGYSLVNRKCVGKRFGTGDCP